MPIKTVRRLKSRHAPKGSFPAHVLTLMTGTTIAQAIPIAISPMLTRIYSPSDFGVFAIFTSLVSMAAIIATGRYELAIMLPDNDEDAVNLLALSVMIAFAVGFIMLLIVMLLNSQIASLLGNQSISICLYWVPLSVILSGIYQAFNYWSSRKKQYNRLAISRISQSASTASTNLLMGFTGFGASGLIGGTILGQSCATGVLAWQTWRDDKGMKKLIAKDCIIENAKKYSDFPLVNSFHAFSDVLQSSGIVFIISAFFGSTVLGFYSFTLRVLRMPLSLIGSSISPVFYQKASEIYNADGDLHLLLRKTMFRLGLIALPIFALIVLFAPEMFAFFFSKNWREAGEFAQILSPWIFLNFIISPISGVYLIVGKQKQAICFGFFDIVLKIGSVALGAYNNNPKLGFYAMSITGVLLLLIEIIWTFSITSNNVVRKRSLQ